MKTSTDIPDKRGSHPDHSVNDLIIKRWSPRAFDRKDISDESLSSLFEAIRWAPSSMNAQPWRFIYSRKGEETFSKISESLMENNKAWAPNAPVLLLALTKKTLPNGGFNGSAKHDLGLAVGNLLVQATSMGIGVHQLGGFSKEKVIESLRIPEDYEPNTVLALGYFGDPDQLPENLKERELSTRHRLPIEDFAFHNQLKIK